MRSSVDPASSASKPRRFVRADFWFLPSIVLYVPFIYVDWVGFTIRHPWIGIPWASYMLGGIIYFLVRFRRGRPAGLRGAGETGGRDDSDSGGAHRGPRTRSYFRSLGVLDWLSFLVPAIFVASVVAILIHYA